MIDTSNLTALVTNADITTPAQQDYYALTIPSGTNGTMPVTMQSSGLSLLEPELFIYNASGTQVGIGHRHGVRRHDHDHLLGRDSRLRPITSRRAARFPPPTAPGPTPCR